MWSGSAPMLTTTDYNQVLVPELAELSQKFEKLRALFYMDENFRGWDLSAGLDEHKARFSIAWPFR